MTERTAYIHDNPKTGCTLAVFNTGDPDQPWTLKAWPTVCDPDDAETLGRYADRAEALVYMNLRRNNTWGQLADAANLRALIEHDLALEDSIKASPFTSPKA